jgi:hypothetical protein
MRGGRAWRWRPMRPLLKVCQGVSAQRTPLRVAEPKAGGLIPGLTPNRSALGPPAAPRPAGGDQVPAGLPRLLGEAGPSPQRRADRGRCQWPGRLLVAQAPGAGADRHPSKGEQGLACPCRRPAGGGGPGAFLPQGRLPDRGAAGLLAAGRHRRPGGCLLPGGALDRGLVLAGPGLRKLAGADGVFEVSQ